jgi:carbonic anhydrase
MGLLEPVARQIQNSALLTSSERQTALERISIRNSIVNLRTFPCVNILENKGKLGLHGAWFDISTGELWVMNAESGDFVRPDRFL